MAVNSRKSFLLMLVASLLSACATPSGDQAGGQPPDRAEYRTYAKDFVDDFARTKLSKNGPHLFCDQTGYLQCYNISQAQCVQELSQVTGDCFKRTEQKFPIS